MSQANVKLAGRETWGVKCKLQIQSFHWQYESAKDGSVEKLEGAIKTYLENYYGRQCVKAVKCFVANSWFTDDNVDINFVFVPEHDVESGTVSVAKGLFASPVFEPSESLSHTIWRAANAGSDGPFRPYAKTVPGTPLWFDSIVYEEAKRGDELLAFTSSTNVVSGLFRSLNTVQASSPEVSGQTVASVAIQDAAKNVFSWDIVPEWLKILAYALPVVLVVGVTGFVGFKLYGLGKRVL